MDCSHEAKSLDCLRLGPPGGNPTRPHGRARANAATWQVFELRAELLRRRYELSCAIEFELSQAGRPMMTGTRVIRNSRALFSPGISGGPDEADAS